MSVKSNEPIKFCVTTEVKLQDWIQIITGIESQEFTPQNVQWTGLEESQWAGFLQLVVKYSIYTPCWNRKKSGLLILTN
jgi:hypothetical protein